MAWDHHLARALKAGCCSLALTMVLGHTTPVRGETPPSAEELWNWYGEASRLHDQGKVNEAWKLYKKIWRYKQSYDVAASMGEICARRAQFALAARYYRFAIETVVPTQSPEFVKAVNEEYAKARREVTEVELHVTPNDVSGLRIVDEENDVELEQPLFLEVGNHRLRAEAPGYAAVTKFVAAKPGALVEWEMELRPLSSVVPDEPRTNKTRHPALVFGVGGAVTLGLGAGAFWMAKQAREQYDDGVLAGASLDRGECSTNPSSRCAELDDAYARAERSEHIAMALGAGAGLAAISTVLVYWLWEDEQAVSVSLGPAPGGGWSNGWKVGVSHVF